jgi:3-deoxy-D-manno-octulosonic-acid transferase
MYLLYTALLILFAAATSPWMVYQALRYRKYVSSLPQRLGRLPASFNPTAQPSIWVHAVSVGELVAARPLIAALRARHPHHAIFVSTTTRSAQELAQRNAADVDGVFYCPIDLRFILRRTLNVVRPELLLIVETDLWPNLLRECHARGVRIAIVNGRLSSRSFPRYHMVRGFFRHVLADIDRFCVQSDDSARRFVALGAAADRVTVTGSLKFDTLGRSDAAPAGTRQQILRTLAFSPSQPVLVAGSTMKGEDAIVLRAFGRLKATLPSATLILAPRHPERFDDVVRQAERAGFETVRRTALPPDGDPQADVIVLDTIGELATVYQLATLAFVGGSLVPTGGHNVLEPAACGRAVLFGPYMRNFAEIANAVVANGAGVQVASEAEFEAQVLALMTDPVRRAALGAAALALVGNNSGANDTTLQVLDALLPPHLPLAAS